MIATDLLIILIIFYAGYVGTKRGFVLVAAELAGFAISTAFATLTYQPGGKWLVWWAGMSASLANVAAFIVIWMVCEIICALFVRHIIIKRLTHGVQYHKYNRIGGAISSVLRAFILLALGLIVFTALPISAASKQPVTGAYLSRLILTATTSWQNAINGGLGRDIGSSLTVFTISNDPESTERTQLGFTTADVKIDSADENADLVLVNHERTSRGLPALVMEPTAQAVARAYGERMLADGVFSHIDNDGHNPFDRMTAGGVKYTSAGENLAFAPTLQLAHTGLMNSPGHKANILSTNYGHVGIGVIDAGQYGLMVVQDFTN